MNRSPNIQSLVIGDKRVKIDAISSKIEQDVFFLEDRILAIKSQAVPNTVILKTYEDMLSSRRSVLHWLAEYLPEDEQRNSLSLRQINR
ncbi:MAG: hypothetical protein ACRBBW_01425 [Cellvibrionaceae bacterium]